MSSLDNSFFFSMMRVPPCSTLFPYTTLFRSSRFRRADAGRTGGFVAATKGSGADPVYQHARGKSSSRSEEHTSELQSRRDLVCRLLLEKKNHFCYSIFYVTCFINT